MKVELPKGRGTLALDLPGDNTCHLLTGEAAAPLDPAEIAGRVSHGIRAHAPKDIARKQIAILIPDDTRRWARGDLYVPHIVTALCDLGVPEERIRIIIALGTHRPMAAEAITGLTGALGGRRVTVLNSANTDPSRLVPVGVTAHGTRVEITREAVDADHVVIFGGVLHHMLAGYGGGRKYIFPGIAGYDGIQHNHSLAIGADGSPHPLVRSASLAGNPVHEDLEEAAQLFLAGKTCTYVAVAANGRGELFHCRVGPLSQTFSEACARLDQACSVPIAAKADFALISAGGHRSDGQLYQATKALFNAAHAVKAGGRILFVAGCAEGVGNQSFAEALSTYKDNPETLGRRLTERFRMPAYVALRVMDLLRRYEICLVSDLDAALAHDLGFATTDDPQRWVDDLTATGYLIPFAENILPLAEKGATPPSIEPSSTTPKEAQ